MLLHNLSLLFHKKINDRALRKSIPSNPNNWPMHWKKVQYKEYPRAKKILLNETYSGYSPSLYEILSKRQTYTDFSKKSVSVQQLSNLLLYSAGINKLRTKNDLQPVRNYPSGGARYPLEIYLYIKHSVEIEEGLYHYNVRLHVLEKISTQLYGDIIEKSIYSSAKDASITLCITSVWNRTLQKYGDFGYQIVLMETGHLTQNIQLMAEAEDFNYCSHLGFDTEQLELMLDIAEAEEESLLYVTSLSLKN